MEAIPIWPLLLPSDLPIPPTLPIILILLIPPSRSPRLHLGFLLALHHHKLALVARRQGLRLRLDLVNLHQLGLALRQSEFLVDHRVSYLPDFNKLNNNNHSKDTDEAGNIYFKPSVK